MNATIAAKNFTEVRINDAGFAVMSSDDLTSLSIGMTVGERRALMLRWLEAELKEVEGTGEDDEWFNAFKKKFGDWDWDLARRDPGPTDEEIAEYVSRLGTTGVSDHNPITHPRTIHHLTADGLR